jgi:DNA primase
MADRFELGFAPRELSAMRQHLNALGIEDDRLLAAGLLVRRDETEELRPRFRDRLIFPIHDLSGHTVGFGGRLLGPGEPKYLNSGESEIFSKGKLLYHLHGARHAIRKADRVLLVEGYFDALRLVDAGVEHVVAPMGTALTESQADLLTRFTKQVVLLYDSDAAGQKATFRAADVLLSKGLEVRVVTLPEGEDPDTFTRSKGREAVEGLIEHAMDVFDRKVQLLERAGWFKDLQHKRRALDRLVPTIRAASDPITRDVYLARAAEAAGIAREVLLQEVHTLRRGRTPVRDSAVRAAGAHDAPGRGATSGPASSAATDPRRAPLSGPYRSRVEQGNAEATLIRVLLTQPVFEDQILEELGKLESEELPGESEATQALEDEAPGILRDELYRAIYHAAQTHGASADPEVFTSTLDGQAIQVYEELRGDRAAVVDARRSIADALRQLRARSLEERVRTLESLLPLAEADEKDRINVQIKQLADEKRSLGVPSWGSTRRSRA